MIKKKKQTLFRNQDKPLIQQISKQISAKKHKLADWLQQKTKNWKKGHQTLFLFILCFVLGGISIYRVVEVFMIESSSSTLSPAKHQPLPLLAVPIAPYPILIKSDTAVFRRFHARMDSLMNTPEGKKVIEQFQKDRPGFMDSLLYLEKLTKQSFPNH